MKLYTKALALAILMIVLSMPVFANFGSLPTFSGNLSEVSYKAVAESDDFYVVEINGVVYKIPKNK